MAEPHDASTCDAFPLAVGLAQVQARYERLEALADKLAEALECLEANVTQAWPALKGMGPVENARYALAAYNLHKIDG